MTTMTTGLAGQQQARSDRRAARQSIESPPRHRGAAGRADGSV
jgi:hypothetical protein